VVAVVGGRGGAGATTLSAALAVTAARRSRRVLLVDGDPLGGGIDLVFHAEELTGLRWPDLASMRGRVPGGALTQALPRTADVALLSWDRGVTGSVPAEALEAVLAAARRSEDLVVVDLPRHVDDTVRVVAAHADLLLLVVPAEVRASAAAARVAARLTALHGDVRLVVRGPAPSGLSAADVAGSLGLPLVGQLKPEPDLDRTLERGEPPGLRSGPLSGLCDRVLDDVLLPVRRAA
jgi:secretion/DNA translocation related CpaE-like protein